jgi:hypothetical protein
MLCLDVRASKNLTAQSNLPAVLRSLQKPNAKGFVNYLASQSTRSSILGQDGFPMGNMINLERSRINRSGQRFIKALYFAETGTPLPPNAVIKVGANTDLRAHDKDTQTIALVLTKFSDQRDREVGTAFSYVAGLGSGISAWFMVLYEFFFLVGTVDCRGATVEKS